MREESFLPQSFLFRVAWSTSLGRPLNTDENGLSYYIITIQITIRKSLLSSLQSLNDNGSVQCASTSNGALLSMKKVFSLE